jgi:hypothetical protein
LIVAFLTKLIIALYNQLQKKEHTFVKVVLERFLGVATKYLDNHLFWFRWLEIGKNMAFENRVEQILISACQNYNHLTIAKLLFSQIMILLKGNFTIYVNIELHIFS